MRKSTFALGLGIALTLGATDLAAQQRPARPDSAKAGARAGGQMGPRGEMGPRGGGRGSMARGPQRHGMLLRDITLTDAQKAQLQARHTSQQEARRASAEANRQAMERARPARQSGDTAALRAFRTEQQARMTAARDAEIAAIRDILTAEQRVQFDKNVATMKERMEKREAGMREGRGQRGPRGARAPQGLQRRG